MQDRLPDKLRSVVAARMRRPYHAGSALAAEAELTALAAELDKTHPGVSASLCEMALCWCAAGMVEAGKQFRRVNGHLHLRSLRDTLEKVTETVAATFMITSSPQPDDHGPPPQFHGTRDILTADRPRSQAQPTSGTPQGG